MFLKRFVAATIIGLSLTVTSAVFAQSDLSMTLDGQVVNSDVPPFIQNDRTMVPVRFISEAFGADVYWDEGARLVTIEKDNGVLIQLTIGSDTMEIVFTRRPEFIDHSDGVLRESWGRIRPMNLDVAAVIRDGRTFVPVRSIAEALGILTSWDAESRTVIFTTLDHLGWVFDDFPEGFVYSEEYQFSGDYGDAFSPREAALKTLPVFMQVMKQGAAWGIEGQETPAPQQMPTSVDIIFTGAHVWSHVGVYMYEFSYFIGDAFWENFHVTMDGELYVFDGRGRVRFQWDAWDVLYLNDNERMYW